MNPLSHHDDDYLSCDAYRGNPDQEGFFLFEESGKWYFSWVLPSGDVILRSEGYSSEAARRQGMDSVLLNRDADENYQTRQLPDGKWVLSLKAANHQEIARSCPVDSEDAARAFLPGERAKLAAARAAHAGEDDYLICREYELHILDVHPRHPDFISFQHENGKHYFAWIDHGKILMRSEGYPAAAPRDNGIASVIQNRDTEERFRIEEAHGAFFISLRAGNNQEIARSCPKDSRAEVEALLPSHRTKAAAHHARAHHDDDYLICREYEEQIPMKDPRHPDFISFHHHNGKYYFAWVDEHDEVLMRGEGYPTAHARDNGIASVIKNREHKERYRVEQKHGVFFLVLRAANNQEIARSCPKYTEAGCWVLIAPHVSAGQGVDAETGLAAGAVAAINAAALAEQRAAEAELEAARLAGAAAAAAKRPQAASTAASGGFSWWWLIPILLLLGLLFWWRSCRMTPGGEQTGMEGREAGISSDTGLNANDTADLGQGQAGEAGSKTPVPADCGLNWILFSFDQFDISPQGKEELARMAEILKQNPGSVAMLNGYTDDKGSDDYNQSLSLKRAEAVRTVLQGMGVEAGRIQISAGSETSPVAQNTEDDSGRQFNRRVELSVRDKSGKELCRSIPPQIPETLKRQQ